VVEAEMHRAPGIEPDGEHRRNGEPDGGEGGAQASLRRDASTAFSADSPCLAAINPFM
jgi:hypothetical protein